MEEVRNAFPGFMEVYKEYPFCHKVEEFRKEAYAELVEDAEFYDDVVTPEKLKQFEEIAEAGAVYRFIRVWDLVCIMQEMLKILHFMRKQ